MEQLRDQRGLPSLEALAADVVFGWRQLVRHRTASVSAILSLGLALGATMAAFRLVDTVLLRPLPVADPARLFVVTTAVHDIDGTCRTTATTSTIRPTASTSRSPAGRPT